MIISCSVYNLLKGMKNVITGVSWVNFYSFKKKKKALKRLRNYLL